MKSYYFVYGTLRRGFENEAAVKIQEQASFCGLASMCGLLYAVSHYPGAVLSNHDHERITGEVYEISDDELGSELIHFIDAYEGVSDPPLPCDEYRKEIVSVTLLENNQEIEATTYLFQKPTEGLRLIENGDFLSSNKSSL